MRIIDTLAHEYGWTKEYILNAIYPDEAVELTSIIRKRTYNQKMLDLAIASNPWSKEPKKLWEVLQKNADSNSKLGDDTEMDKAGLQMLKQQLKSKSKAIKVK
jgi:hypothetical protein